MNGLNPIVTDGAWLSAIAVDPAGKFVYATDAFSGVVRAYAIDAATGMLTAIGGSPFTAGTNPVSLAIVQETP